MTMLPRIGWIPITPEEAMDFGFESAAWYRWEVFGIRWGGFGLAIRARPAGLLDGIHSCDDENCKMCFVDDDEAAE